MNVVAIILICIAAQKSLLEVGEGLRGVGIFRKGFPKVLKVWFNKRNNVVFAFLRVINFRLREKAVDLGEVPQKCMRTGRIKGGRSAITLKWHKQW